MSQKPRGSITSVEPRKAPPPVKVRLKRVTCDHAIPYPPDGQAREWWQRLRNAFGTASSAFVQASLYQLNSFLMESSMLHRSSILSCCSSTGGIVTGTTGAVSDLAMFETTCAAKRN